MYVYLIIGNFKQKISHLNISVIEFEGHIECLYSFLKIFQPSNNIQINAYISQILSDEIESVKHNFKNVEFIVKQNDQSINQFLNDHLSKINLCDYIIFNTIQKEPHQYQLNRFKAKTIIRIHNINTFLNRKGNIKLDWNWYALYKDLSYFIREYLWAKQTSYFNKLLADADFIMLPDDSYTSYVVENKIYPSKKIFPSIPMAVYDSSFKKEINENVLTICITGTIDEKRKNYLLAYEAIATALPNIYGKLNLILLGAPKGPYGLSVLKKFKSIKASNFELISFNNRINQSAFESYLKETDILLAPVVVETRYKFFKEIYGTTKISGSITDMIRYGKPLLLTDQYQLSKKYTNFIMPFANQNDLKKLIINISKNKLILTELQHNLASFLKKFETQKIGQKITNDFNVYKDR